MKNDDKKLIESKIYEYLSSNPDFAKKIVDMFTSKEEKTENRRNLQFKKFAPVLLVGSLVIGGTIGGIVGKNVAELSNSSYPTTYANITEAPIELQQAYVEDQYSKFTTSSMTNNDEGARSFQQFEKIINEENPNVTEIAGLANTISNGTNSDGIESTLPFEYTDYSKSIVKDGEVYVPAKGQLEDGTELITQNGSLYKKGR